MSLGDFIQPPYIEPERPSLAFLFRATALFMKFPTRDNTFSRMVKFNFGFYLVNVTQKVSSIMI